MMEAIPRDYGQGQFDAFCKKVLKNEATGLSAEYEASKRS